VRWIRGVWGRLAAGWEAGLGRLPFFTQRTAVLLVGVLVATLALLGGVVALVGWPGAGGPTRLVPGERAGRAPESRPGPGEAAAPGAEAPGTGDRSGVDAGGAAATSPVPAPTPRTGPAGTSSRPGAPGGVGPGGGATGSQGPGGAAAGGEGSGGAAGAGAGGPSAAPPTTPPPTTTPPRLLDPVQELVGPVVSTLVP
jgi:hypothetical protein